MARSPSTVVAETTLGTSISFTKARIPSTVVTETTLGTSISFTKARSPSTVVPESTLGTSISFTNAVRLVGDFFLALVLTLKLTLIFLTRSIPSATPAPAYHPCTHQM